MTLSAPSAEGKWAGGYAVGLPRAWEAGWDRSHRCPPDPKGDSSPGMEGWRDIAAVGGQRWHELHNDRRRVVRALRRAGYVARHRWPRELMGTRKQGVHILDDWRYIDGPAVGRYAVDPWDIAGRLEGCAAVWQVNLRQRSDGTLTAVPIPLGCNQKHLCPVCAAGASSARARAVRTVLLQQHQEAPAALALATFTQRATSAETLAGALDRFRSAWGKLRLGRTGEDWRQCVEGAYLGHEVTRGAGGLWWHAHCHVVIRLRPGIDEAEARARIGLRWAQATAAAAEEAELPGHGWDPVAGGCSTSEAGIVLDWAGDWWKTINPERPKEVYQAAKYACPVVDLDPASLAEFCAASYLKHWHQGYGCLRSVAKLAEELEGSAWEMDEVEGLREGSYEEAPMDALDLGASVAAIGPGACPLLDEVAPDLGRPDEESRPPAELPSVSRFRLSRDAVSAVAAAAQLIGGVMSFEGALAIPVLYLPRAWVADEVRANAAALEERRRREEAAAAAARIKKELQRQEASAKSRGAT